jgi:hypothetical protein
MSNDSSGVMIFICLFLCWLGVQSRLARIPSQDNQRLPRTL